MNRVLALTAAVVLAGCSPSGTSADIDALVEAYVIAVRAREVGESEAEVLRRVDEWLAGEGLNRDDLTKLSRRLDQQPHAWARVWNRIDERLRTPADG